MGGHWVGITSAEAADAAPTEREPRTPQMFDPLATMVGEFARDFVAPTARIEAIDRLYVLLREARSAAAGAATETGGLPSVDQIYELLWHERDRLDAGISGFNEALYRRAARYIASGLASGADREDGEAGEGREP